MEEAGRKSEKMELLPGEDHRYVFFDHSHSSVTAFHPKEAHFGNFEYMKRVAVDALQIARAGGTKTNSFVVQTLGGGAKSDISDEDYEVKSDAESMRQHIKDGAAMAAIETPSDEDSSVDDVLKEKKVRKKLEVLAQMVGVDSEKPGVVLDEVVRVLRDLERNASQL